jgi:hypothetical protein
MPRVLFGLLLLAHGAIHLAWLVPAPADPKWPFLWRSPWLPHASEEKLRDVGTALITLMFLAFFVAALGVWGVPFLAGAWGAIAVVGCALSLIVISLLWHPWFVVGPTVDLLIAAAVLFNWVA